MNDNHDTLWTWRYADGGPPSPEGIPVRLWSRRPILRRTDRFLFVDLGGGETARIDKAAFADDGTAWSRRHRERFYTADAMENAKAEDRRTGSESRHRDALRDLSFGCRQMELGDRLDFEEVAPGILKIRGGPVFVHDGRQETCEACQGKPDPRTLAGIKRRTKVRYVAPDHVERINRCGRCFGTGITRAVDNFFARQAIKSTMQLQASLDDLDEVRENFVREEALHGWRNTVAIFRVYDMTRLKADSGTAEAPLAPLGGRTDAPPPPS